MLGVNHDDFSHASKSHYATRENARAVTHPSGVIALRSTPQVNVCHTDEHQKEAKLPEYWPIMISLNGYDVEIPILRDNAMQFCESIQKELGGGKGNDNGTAPATGSKAKSGSEKGTTRATVTPMYDAGSGSASAAATTEKTPTSTNNGFSISETQRKSKGKKVPETPTASSDASDASTTDESGSSTSTGKKTSSRSSSSPTPSESSSSEGTGEEGKDEDIGDEEDPSISTTPPVGKKGMGKTLLTNVTSQASNFSSHKATSTPTSTTPSEELSVIVGEKTFIRVTSIPTTDSALPTAGLKRRGAGGFSDDEDVVPWYRAPFVWMRRGVHVRHNGDDHSEDVKVEKEQEPEEGDDEESTSGNGAKSTTKATASAADAEDQDSSAKSTKSRAKPTRSKSSSTDEEEETTTSSTHKTKPALTKTSTHAKTSTLANAADDGEETDVIKTTFRLAHSTSTASPTPTSDPDSEGEESSSSEAPTTTSKDKSDDDKADSSTNTRHNKSAKPTDSGMYSPSPLTLAGLTPLPDSAEPTETPLSTPDADSNGTKSDPESSDSSGPTSKKPTKTTSHSSSSTSTGKAGSTPAPETNETTKHAPKIKTFMSMYIFWGTLYLTLGFWEMWRQTRADYHWKRWDEWVEGYGKGIEADGRAPVGYALGRGKKQK
ncbi:hypothetical protein K458DRAFT_5533 [Lentithecium fluviatile CBS 122367]|uniref:Uncharacterized protein n=1 Tax=Lentithecium fluviatile CBS 122367 TaxID=1168545 RepID=A0A6G1JNT7_9PLEO|nr:hypothetical protein K458DRAFT_5533 [Lentithecium fluviatile CBS 122367]